MLLPYAIYIHMYMDIFRCAYWIHIYVLICTSNDVGRGTGWRPFRRSPDDSVVLLRPPVCLLLRPPRCSVESTKSVCDLCLSACLSRIPKSQSVAPWPYNTGWGRGLNILCILILVTKIHSPRTPKTMRIFKSEANLNAPSKTIVVYGSKHHSQANFIWIWKYD